MRTGHGPTSMNTRPTSLEDLTIYLNNSPHPKPFSTLLSNRLILCSQTVSKESNDETQPPPLKRELSS